MIYMNTQNAPVPTPERRGPSMPRFMFKLMNPLMKALLYSPFHGRVSKSLMLLSFTGRKSGKKFTTPVGYLRQDRTIIVFTHSPWWKNMIGGAPVSMRIQGKNTTGVARPVNDPVEIKSMVRNLMASSSEDRARQMGFWVDDLDASPQEIQKAVAGTILVKIQLDGK
jgi:hypothetical protein